MHAHMHACMHAHTHTHTEIHFAAFWTLSEITQVSYYQTNLHFTEARDRE